MAKDGTLRGGRRPGVGAKKKPLYDKIITGNPGGRALTAMNFDNIPDVDGADMPKPSDMLDGAQYADDALEATAIYEKTWKWLAARGCEKLITPLILEQYAMSAARWIQCERAVSRYGFVGKHPTTGAPMASVYVSMSQNYMNQCGRIWGEIYQTVKENCSGDYGGKTPQEDMMEQLLSAKEKNG